MINRLFSRLMLLSILVGGLWFPSVLSADAPLPKPREVTFWSPDRSVCAVSNPERQLTTVFRVHPQTGHKTKLWQMYGWLRSAFVANDGRHLVIGYPGLNLLTTKYVPDQPMAYFVREGEVFHVIALNNIIRNPEKMPRTASHYAWGHCSGIDQEGHFVIETFDNLRHVFDLQTGQKIK